MPALCKLWQVASVIIFSGFNTVNKISFGIRAKSTLKKIIHCWLTFLSSREKLNVGL